jgi:hypothetical protein
VLALRTLVVGVAFHAFLTSVVFANLTPSQLRAPRLGPGAGDHARRAAAGRRLPRASSALAHAGGSAAGALLARGDGARAGYRQGRRHAQRPDQLAAVTSIPGARGVEQALHGRSKLARTPSAAALYGALLVAGLAISTNPLRSAAEVVALARGEPDAPDPARCRAVAWASTT